MQLFKFMMNCKNNEDPDSHSFVIQIDDGQAFVDCREHEVFMECEINGRKSHWAGSYGAAEIRLIDLGAKIQTINM